MKEMHIQRFSSFLHNRRRWQTKPFGYYGGTYLILLYRWEKHFNTMHTISSSFIMISYNNVVYYNNCRHTDMFHCLLAWQFNWPHAFTQILIQSVTRKPGLYVYALRIIKDQTVQSAVVRNYLLNDIPIIAKSILCAYPETKIIYVSGLSFSNWTW